MCRWDSAGQAEPVSEGSFCELLKRHVHIYAEVSEVVVYLSAHVDRFRQLHLFFICAR